MVHFFPSYVTKYPERFGNESAIVIETFMQKSSTSNARKETLVRSEQEIHLYLMNYARVALQTLWLVSGDTVVSVSAECGNSAWLLFLSVPARAQNCHAVQ